MECQPIFENIAERVGQEIIAAKKTIFVAVAWFTNRNLFELLVKSAERGCVVTIIITDDEINHNSGIADFVFKNVRVFKIGIDDAKLMHNKFCVIDYDTVITGSYNWTYKAENDNIENVIIIKKDKLIAYQYIEEFRNILIRYWPNETLIELFLPLNRILESLNLIRIGLLNPKDHRLYEELDELSSYDLPDEVQVIINLIKSGEIINAIELIDSYISNNQKMKLRKLIAKFHHKHSMWRFRIM